MTHSVKEHQEAPATRSASGEVRIDATPERVWQALTEARELERWFPLHANVSPGPGGSLWMSWGDEYTEAMPIKAWDPPRHLRTAWPWGGNAIVTDYHLSADGDATLLRVVTSGFSNDAGWDDWVEGTVRGWAFELRSLKHYLERHGGQDRRALFLRRRVQLSREDVWDRLTRDAGLADHWLHGERIDETPLVQLAMILDEPADAMIRVSVEPVHADNAAHGDGASHDATLFISLWGYSASRLDAIDGEWTEALERIFPEGTTLRAAR